MVGGGRREVYKTETSPARGTGWFYTEEIISIGQLYERTFLLHFKHVCGESHHGISRC